MSVGKAVFALAAVSVILLGGTLAVDSQLQAGDTPTAQEEGFADILGGGLQASQVVVLFFAVVVILGAVGVFTNLT